MSHLTEFRSKLPRSGQHSAEIGSEGVTSQGHDPSNVLRLEIGGLPLPDIDNERLASLLSRCRLRGSDKRQGGI